MNPKPGEVYVTHAGRYVIVVGSGEFDERVAMLWMDDWNGLTVSRICDRLWTKSNLDASKILQMWSECQTRKS